jgi:hypothetical protein
MSLRNFRLDDEKWEAFKKLCGEQRLSASGEISRMIDLYLAGHIPQLEARDEKSLFERISDLTSELAQIKERVISLEKSSQDALQASQNPTPIYSIIAGAIADWLPVASAHRILVERGFQRSLRTFRRMLAGAIAVKRLPEELVALGLDADFELRAREKDQAPTRWLRFRE